MTHNNEIVDTRYCKQVATSSNTIFISGLTVMYRLDAWTLIILHIQYRTRVTLTRSSSGQILWWIQCSGVLIVLLVWGLEGWYNKLTITPDPLKHNRDYVIVTWQQCNFFSKPIWSHQICASNTCFITDVTLICVFWICIMPAFGAWRYLQKLVKILHIHVTTFPLQSNNTGVNPTQQ